MSWCLSVWARDEVKVKRYMYMGGGAGIHQDEGEHGFKNEESEECRRVAIEEGIGGMIEQRLMGAKKHRWWIGDEDCSA